jgi:ATP-dependent DNA helicase RecG
LSREIPPATAKKLARLGIRSRRDLVLHLPHRYEDETRLTPLSEANREQLQVVLKEMGLLG